MAAYTRFLALMGVPRTGFDPEHTFETSWILTPHIHAYIRLFIAFYCWVSIFITWMWMAIHLNDSNLIPLQWIYFTDLSYWGLAFYFTFAGLHTLVYARNGYSWLDRWPKFLQACHTLLYTTVVTLPFLVTGVFWGLLYAHHWFKAEYDAWTNVSMHLLNSVFAFFELLFTATDTPPWLHGAFLILILLLYLALAYIVHATRNIYPYPFLDPSKGGRGKVAAYCAGITAGFVVVFLLARTVIFLRKKFTPPAKKSRVDPANPTYVQQVDVEMIRSKR